MKRYVFSRYGALRDVVRLEEAPRPALQRNDVLVKISAAALNPIDLHVMKGHLRKIQRLALPAPLGFDFCGLVEAVGPGGRSFKIGDRVFGRAPRERMGAFAEYLAIDATLVAGAPALLTDVEAASLPLVALTTLQALSLRAEASPGQSVLIHAGSGGLGSFAVQYAKRTLGLNVTTTTSAKNLEWVAALGADVVIAYDRESYLGRPARYDIVFDTLGGTATADAFQVL
ncbi:MAG: NADP-dependent oxidoreductase, partial [Pseudomonadota bacterium]